MRIHEQVPLSRLTTMRLGGSARFVVEIESEEEVAEAFSFAAKKNLPFFILGGGANTIARDEGFDGVVIINRIKGINLTEIDDNGSAVTNSENRGQKSGKTYHLTASGGEEWDKIVEIACKNGLTGIEALSKIPGLAGAAPVQNIGAYGQEVADTFVSAKVYDTKAHEKKTLLKNDFGFSYRKSILNTTDQNRYFVISITLELKSGQMKRPFYNSIEKYILETNATDFSPAGIRKIVSTIRADKLPDPKVKASAGSFFKNVYLSADEAKRAEAKGLPVYHGRDGFKINSGWLIEESGLSGKLLHGFRVNKKAALVLINESATSYEDLAKARTEIREKVKANFGFCLEQEPVEISSSAEADFNPERKPAKISSSAKANFDFDPKQEPEKALNQAPRRIK